MEKVEKLLEKVVFDTFSTIFMSLMIPEAFQQFVEKVEKVVKNNFFHDLGLHNGLSRGKNLVLTTFSTNFHEFLRKTLES